VSICAWIPGRHDIRALTASELVRGDKMVRHGRPARGAAESDLYVKGSWLSSSS
jgi:hypothetical protein